MLSSFHSGVEALIAEGPFTPPTRPDHLARLDRYEVRRIVGQGGMGLVVLAWDPQAQRQVAIKLLKPEFLCDARTIHRFRVEAQHMQKLKHPHILPVLEVGSEEQGCWFVMPWCELGSLSRWIQPGRPLDAEKILLYTRQLAQALSYAHRRGIIHRDIKPGNLLLESDTHVRLADFGLARTVFNDSLVDVAASHCEGTLPYLSPAVAAGEAEDTRCDIYSFGAVMYEMLTGHRPYDGNSKQEILDKIRQGPPRPIHELNPQAPKGLITVAETAMARELRDRYASMDDVLADLERIARGEEPLGPARPSPSALPRPAHGRARKKWLVALGACLAIGLVALVVWGSQYTLREIDTFESPFVPDFAATSLGDADGDGDLDFFLADDLRWLVQCRNGRRYGSYPPPVEGALRLYMVAAQDFNHDGSADAWLSYNTETNMGLAVVNVSRYVLQRFELPGSPVWRTNVGTIYPGLGFHALTN